MRWIGPKPTLQKIGTIGAFRVFNRMVGALVLVVLFVPLMVMCRVLGWTGWQSRVAQIGSRLMLAVIGLKLRVDGQDTGQPGAVVANHTSWLDIFVLYAAVPGQFVAKAEVSKWPGIGVLGKLVGTIFIDRVRTQAASHVDFLKAKLGKRERLIFFPEGTSTDGQRILTFRSTLFEVFLGGGSTRDLALTPVFLKYQPVAELDERYYGFYSGTDFGKHMLHVLALKPGGAVDASIGAPLSVAEFETRKELAQSAETALRALAPDQIAKRSANDFSVATGSSLRQTSAPSATKST